MIDLMGFGALFVIVCLLLLALAESETFAELSERRAVNRMADRSRKQKAQTVRPQCRYSRAGIQK